jgi:hypothetical protein
LISATGWAALSNVALAAALRNVVRSVRMPDARKLFQRQRVF